VGAGQPSESSVVSAAGFPSSPTTERPTFPRGDIRKLSDWIQSEMAASRAGE
jgi:hypothetical protein